MAHQPSTDWREVIAPNDEERYAQYAEQFSEMQRRKSAKYGNGRALHRKQILGLPAKLEVLSGLPEYAQAGLFAQAREYQALVRLSNGGSAVAPDKVPDIRGFSFKVLGIHGASALGGETDSQDFLLINREVFGMKGSKEFAGLVKAAEQGPSGLLKHFIREEGLFKGFQKIRSLQASMQKPFHGFAAHTFFSSAPIACGKYAARVRLVPDKNNGAPAVSNENWTADILARLEKSSLSYALQLQFFVNETLTPIEDASVNWEEKNSPYTTVGKLTLPRLDEWAAEREQIQERTEKGIFDPWCALAEHRPLGDVMRARKVVYYQSQKNRA